MFRRKTDQPSIDVARLSSLIAAGVEIAGDVIVTDGVRIDGQVVGNVLSKPDTKGLLVLSEQGRIEGNVRMHDAVINGTVQGVGSKTRQPRTAMGLSEGGGKLYLMVVDGRQPNHSMGVTRFGVGLNSGTATGI